MKLIICLAGHKFTEAQLTRLREHLERLETCTGSCAMHLELPRGAELTVFRVDAPAADEHNCKLEEIVVRYPEEESGNA